MALLDGDCRADHREGLHLGDLRVGDIQAHPSVPHHRVELVQRVDQGLDLVHALVLGIRQPADVRLLGRHKLMQRRVQEADRDRRSLQCLVELLEIALLDRQDLRQRLLSLLHRVGADHLAEGLDPVLLKEHVLGPAQPDALSSKLMRPPCVCRRVRVRADLHSPVLVRPAHDAAELPDDLRLHGRNDALIDLACGAVCGDPVPFMEGMSVDREAAVVLIHIDRGDT